MDVIYDPILGKLRSVCTFYGVYNKFNISGKIHTIFSIGIGSSNTDRKNAFEVMNNGNVFLYGIGGFDGTNPFSSISLQDFLKRCCCCKCKDDSNGDNQQPEPYTPYTPYDDGFLGNFGDKYPEDNTEDSTEDNNIGDNQQPEPYTPYTPYDDGFLGNFGDIYPDGKVDIQYEDPYTLSDNGFLGNFSDN